MINKWLAASRNWYIRRVTLQSALIGVVQVSTLFLLAHFTPHIQISGIFSAIAATILYGFSQTFAWVIFIRFFSRLHPALYPLFTFLLSGLLIMVASYILPGFYVASIYSGLIVVISLTVTSTVAGVLIGYDDDSWFDFNVTRPLVEQSKAVIKSDQPGFVFLEIDGLSIDVLELAMKQGYMPTLSKWLATGTHKLQRWETDFSSQTAAMQAGILQGNNDGIIAYRWYDRQEKKVINSANPFVAMSNEGRLSNKHGLLSDGGASRGNMYSGDAAENLFTYSTLFDRNRGTSPGFYLFLLSPYVLTRTITKYILEVFAEVYDELRQWFLNYQPRIKRQFPYHLFRGLMNSILPEVVTYTAITDILRGIPAMYLLYPGYDDLGHFSGINRPDSLNSLGRTDAQISRILNVITKAPRPYYLTILSDHGQSQGVPFRQRYGKTIDVVIRELVQEKMNVYADLDSHEAQDLANAVLTDVSGQKLRSAGLVRKLFAKKTHLGYIDVTKGGKTTDEQVPNEALVVLSSGSLGLIYAATTQTRMSMEEIEEVLPGFIDGLVQHPGIGYVLVQSKQSGPIVFGKQGKIYLSSNKIEGVNPLEPYGEHAAQHLLRANNFATMPDVLINGTYDPQTGEIGSFEEQVGHHGGLGGMQNRPFLFHDATLPVPDEIIGSTELYKVLRGWRNR